MFRLIIIAGLLFSHSVFATQGGDARLKKMLSCEAAMQAAPNTLLGRAKALLDKYELLNTVTPDILKARMNMSPQTFLAELSSLVKQALTSPPPAEIARLSQILDGLENVVDSTLAHEQKKARFDGRGKARMETRMFDNPMEWGDYPLLPQEQQQQQQQMRPLNPQPPVAPPYYREDHGFGFRPNWPPREKP